MASILPPRNVPLWETLRHLLMILAALLSLGLISFSGYSYRFIEYIGINFDYFSIQEYLFTFLITFILSSAIARVAFLIFSFNVLTQSLLRFKDQPRPRYQKYIKILMIYIMRKRSAYRNLAIYSLTTICFLVLFIGFSSPIYYLYMMMAAISAGLISFFSIVQISKIGWRSIRIATIIGDRRLNFSFITLVIAGTFFTGYFRAENLVRDKEQFMCIDSQIIPVIRIATFKHGTMLIKTRKAEADDFVSIIIPNTDILILSRNRNSLNCAEL